MDVSDVPTLEVGFAIEAGGSFDTLSQIQRAMDTTEAKVIADAAKIEKATAGMVSIGGAAAAITAFGNANSREMQAVVRDRAQVERAGERLVAQLERQNASFGKTREELRALRTEEQAVAAERVGNTDLAQRLRAQEQALYDQEFAAARRARLEAESATEDKAMAAQQAVAAAEKEAQALRSAALAYNMFEAAARRGAQALREQEAAEKALARDAAAAQARAEAAATKQLADEHQRLADIVRASHAAQEADAQAAERMRAATDPLYAATKRLNAEIAESTRLYHAGATAPEEYARQQQVLAQALKATTQQHNAMATASGKNAFALKMTAVQIPDIVQGLLTGQKPMTVFIQQGGQVAQIAQMAEGGIKGYAASLGGLALRFAPLLIGASAAVGAFALFDRAVSKGVDTKKMIDGLGLTHAQIKRLENTSVSSGDVIKATFQVMAERVGLSTGNMGKRFGDLMDWMTSVGRNAMAALYASVVGTFSAMARIQQGIITGKSLGEVLSDLGNGYKKAFNDANGALKRFGADVTKQIATNKLADLRKQAAEMKADEKPKKDGHAEQLAREAAAIEAQIKNLYALADAYKVSGAEALIAEARAKAESQAIKQRADIEAAVDRQVRLAIAQRVSDAAKAAASTRDQATVQTEVNAAVANGLIPAERAAELLRDRIAELPLLHAIEAAQQRGLKKEAEAATKALEEQRDAQARAKAAEIGKWAAATDSAADRRLAELREEQRLIGATDDARIRALATIRATNEALAGPAIAGTPFFDAYVAKQVQIAAQEHQNRLEADAYNNSLRERADLLDVIADNIQRAGQGMADAFGNAGRALGDMATIFAGHVADQERLKYARTEQLKVANQIEVASKREAEVNRINALFAARNATSQIGLFGDMTAAAKGFFDEKSKGYKALATAEKVFRAIEFALSLRAMIQHGAETASAVANSAIRAAKYAVEAVAKAISSMPFPLNLVAGAATAAALASLGISIVGAFGGGGNNLPKANDGTGTVLGDSTAKSESIKRSLDALKEVDTTMLTFSRQMAASLKSIDSQIGSFAAVLVRNSSNINASAGVTEGFKANIIGSVLGSIPVIGGILKGLFGTTTTVLGNGLYGGAQSVGSILNGGFNAQYYSDIEKKSKFLGIVTSKKYSTQYSAADPALTNQFTLILRQFNDAIAAAAGPLGQSTTEIQNRLNGFVVNIGKIDLKGLTGQQIQEKLEAVFGQVADNMANAAFPGISRFQKVGEGAFETLVRVASTVEAVTAALGQLGSGAVKLSVDAKLALADQFDSVSAFTDAVGSYFTSFYTKEEQAAAKTAQFAQVFQSLGLTMPSSIAAFRQLVEAQDLNTAAGRDTYATLLKLAPAFAELQTSLLGAKSAADIATERQDLERQLLDLQGNKAALRALDLAKLDASNRALQQQIWAIQDAQDAAKAAQALADAWTSVGNSIMDEVKRIRGLTGSQDGSFATLMGQFNAANASARAGDQDAAKSLPGLSQALLKAAGDSATSRQELDRVQAQTAAQLEATYKAITALAAKAGGSPASTDAAILAAVSTASQASQPAQAANDDLLAEVKALRAEVAAMRTDNNSGNAAIAGNTGRIAKKMDDVTAASGGDAISTRAA